ncbi:threonine transporter RhtB [Acinetobacter gandensis]|uniref:Threonine transporter RhtB n=1 Tax=Acinetobacter gandensis TaxID=1443941 RepID=A0A1A7R7M4_9GAMM|nr:MULTISPECIES: LysE family transporter [Acinetobacter]KAB0625181.1 threonine transporter RhtB [Acinetobacter gandensis]OBX28255.1 threonine transporter RhtB [Acinetobacter gandensis]
MIESWLFVLAMMAVLMTPGPSNALLASSAHQQGMAKTIVLVPAELMGYFYAINIWALIIHLSAPVWPNLIHILHFLSIVYVLWLAFHLWKSAHLQQHNQKHPSIQPRELFLTSLKNPKAILFAAGIFPLETWNSPLNFVMVFAVFALVLLPVALFWMSFGRAILSGQNQKIKADLLYKGSALMLILCMFPVVFRFFA